MHFDLAGSETETGNLLMRSCTKLFSPLGEDIEVYTHQISTNGIEVGGDHQNANNIDHHTCFGHFSDPDSATPKNDGVRRSGYRHHEGT